MKLTDNEIITDNDIKSALTHCVNDDNCEKCPLRGRKLGKGCLPVKGFYSRIVDLINRKDKRIAELQLKINELEIELKAMRGAANSYKAEVERLKAECKNQSTLWSQHFESLYETTKESIKDEAINYFVDRFVEEYSLRIGEDGEVDEIIDDVLKEMAGEPE